MPSEKMPLVSIIIPTKNEERNIGRCLEAIRNSTYKNIEIVIVDQSSTDKTQEIATSYGAIVINLPPTDKYVPPSNSRNIGFQKSNGDFIYHMDADMEVTADLIKECVEVFENDESVSAIVIPEKDVPLNIWARGKAFERRLYGGTDMEAARISRRANFEKVGYSKEIFSGEDWNIDNEFRKAGTIARSKNLVNHHIGSISLSREFKKKRHYGTGSTVYVQQNKASLFSKLLMLSKIYFIGTIKGIFTDPIACFAFIIIRTVDVVGLFLGYFQNKFTNEKHSK